MVLVTGDFGEGEERTGFRRKRDTRRVGIGAVKCILSFEKIWRKKI